MGDAKRRRRFDSTFGRPEVYTLQIIPCKGLLAEERVAKAVWIADRATPPEHYNNPVEVIITDQVQFCVPRGRNSTETNLKAIAIAHTIVGFLSNPTVPEWIQKIADERCLGEGALVALDDIAQCLNRFYTRLDGDLMDKEDRGEVIFTNVLEAAEEPNFHLNDSDAIWRIAVGQR